MAITTTSTGSSYYFDYLDPDLTTTLSRPIVDPLLFPDEFLTGEQRINFRMNLTESSSSESSNKSWILGISADLRIETWKRDEDDAPLVILRPSDAIRRVRIRFNRPGFAIRRLSSKDHQGDDVDDKVLMRFEVTKIHKESCDDDADDEDDTYFEMHVQIVPRYQLPGGRDFFCLTPAMTAFLGKECGLPTYISDLRILHSKINAYVAKERLQPSNKIIHCDGVLHALLEVHYIEAKHVYETLLQLAERVSADSVDAFVGWNTGKNALTKRVEYLPVTLNEHGHVLPVNWRPFTGKDPKFPLWSHLEAQMEPIVYTIGNQKRKNRNRKRSGSKP